MFFLKYQIARFCDLLVSNGAHSGWQDAELFDWFVSLDSGGVDVGVDDGFGGALPRAGGLLDHGLFGGRKRVQKRHEVVDEFH